MSRRANSPQAKGRVERMHQTLQDRLVKELRLRGTATIAETNAFPPEFMEDFNRRFAKPAPYDHDAHRPLPDSDDFDRLFACGPTEPVVVAVEAGQMARVAAILVPSQLAFFRPYHLAQFEL